jgi:hypothetical protein
MIGDSGVVGKNDAVKELTNMPCEVKSFELSDFKVTFFGAGTAFLTYKGIADGTCGG